MSIRVLILFGELLLAGISILGAGMSFNSHQKGRGIAYSIACLFLLLSIGFFGLPIFDKELWYECYYIIAGLHQMDFFGTVLLVLGAAYCLFDYMHCIRRNRKSVQLSICTSISVAIFAFGFVAFLCDSDGFPFTRVLILAVTAAFVWLISYGVDRAGEAKKQKLRIFWEKCKSLDIQDMTDPVQRGRAIQIAEMMNIYPDEGIEQISSGSSMSKRERKSLKKDRKAKLVAAYQTNKDDAKICGKDKYLEPLLRKRKILKTKHKEIKKHNPMSLYKSHKDENWAIAGGMAHAIGGLGAGVAAAMEVQRRNAQKREEVETYNKSLLQAGVTPELLQNSYDSLIEKGRDEILKIEENIERIQNALFYDSDQGALFQKLALVVIGTPNEDGDLSLTVRPRILAPSVILNKPAILDGSVRIIVSDDGEAIGDAYFCAVGYGETELEKAGFAATNWKDITARPFRRKAFEPGKKYSFLVEPCYLWEIEV